jgi:hypothetical protein
LGVLNAATYTPVLIIDHTFVSTFRNPVGNTFVNIGDFTGATAKDNYLQIDCAGGNNFAILRFTVNGSPSSDLRVSTAAGSTQLTVAGTVLTEWKPGGTDFHGYLNVIQTSAGNAAIGGNFTGGGYGIIIKALDLFSTAYFAAWSKSDGSFIGSVTRVGTTDAVAYNTTSDGRIKENIRDFTGEDSGKLIDGLRPRWFDWKSGGEGAVGFIAQEEAAVDPVLSRIGAVTVGDANPFEVTKLWQRNDSALVPILVAELKSMRSRLQLLEATHSQ